MWWQRLDRELVEYPAIHVRRCGDPEPRQDRRREIEDAGALQSPAWSDRGTEECRKSVRPMIAGVVRRHRIPGMLALKRAPLLRGQLSRNARVRVPIDDDIWHVSSAGTTIQIISLVDRVGDAPTVGGINHGVCGCDERGA